MCTRPGDAKGSSLAWGKFKQAYSKEEVETLLTTASELAKNEAEGEQSLRQHQSNFLSHVTKLRTLLNKLADRDSFEAFLLLVGPHLNEDAELGAIVTTPGLDTFVDDIQSCEGDIIAAAKLTAYQSSMRDIRIATVPNSTTSEAAINAITPKVDADAEALPSKPKKPSKTGAAEKEKIRKDGHQGNIRSLRARISDICQTDTGLDLFNLENNNFLCVGTAGVMAANDLIITGYPPGARLPALYPANKATGAWRVPGLCVLNAAIDARDLGPLAGLRFERRPSEDGDYVIFSHDYRLPPPPPGASATAVTKFWRTSGGAQLLCTTSTNMSFEVAYDLRADNPVISIGRGVLLNTSDTFRLPLPGSADPKPKLSTKAKGKGKAKPTKGRGKRKAEWSDGDNNNNNNENDAFEDEEPTSPHPTKKPSGESRTDSAAPPPEPPLEPRTTRAPLQEGGGKATAATPAPIAPPRSQRRAAAAANKMIRGDVSDNDDVPIQAPARPLRTKPRTVNIESSDSEAGVPVQQSGEGSPRKQVGRAGNSRRQTMDFVEVPPSPVRRPATVGRPFRTVFDGTGQPAGMSFEGDKPGLYDIEWAPPKPAGASLSKQYGPAPVASSSRPSPTVIAAQSWPAPASAVPSSRPPAGSSLQPPAASSRQGSLQPSAPAASSSQQASLQPRGSAGPSSRQSSLQPGPPSRQSSMQPPGPPPSGPAASSRYRPPPLGPIRQPRTSAPPIAFLEETPRPSGRKPVPAPARAPAAAPARAPTPPPAPAPVATAQAPAPSSAPPLPPNVAQMLNGMTPAQMQAMLAAIMTQAAGSGAAPQ
ncbi:hypothetical protein B0H14DRAFT_3457949 [Mycena olivaceomarginata]|nr:hypothetical protein B0H14DRAFT_3457949 [Mycena olivaceomarginata]